MISQELGDLLVKREELNKQRHEQIEALRRQISDLSEDLVENKDEEVEELRTVLGAAKEKLAEQNELLQRLTTPPSSSRRWCG